MTFQYNTQLLVPENIPIVVDKPSLVLDASTRSVAFGGLASKVTDISGNGYDAFQNTGANQPSYGSITQNGRNMLGFNGSSSYMTIASNTFMAAPLTLFAVAKQTSLGSSGYIIVCYASGAPIGSTYLTLVSGTLQARVRNGDGIARIVNYSSPQDTSAFIACIRVVNGQPLYLNVNNGTPVQDSVTLSGQGSAVGYVAIGVRPASLQSDFLNGAVGKIIAYNKALSDTQVSSVFKSLSYELGIAIS